MASRFQVQKTYTITNAHSMSTKSLEVHDASNQPILWINRKKALFESTQINIQSQSQTGPVLAAVRLNRMGSGCKAIVGNPDATPKEAWSEVMSESLRGARYSFVCDKRQFMWKRTHNSDLGASSWRGFDFKLIETNSPDQVLAAYIEDKQMFTPSQVGKIDYMVELGQGLELMSMAAVLGIVQQAKQKSRAGGAGAAGAAGGGGGA